MFNTNSKLTEAYILLQKTIKSKLQCMNVDNNQPYDTATNQTNIMVKMFFFQMRLAK